jgi:putative protease
MEAPELETHWACAANQDGIALARGAGCVRAVLSPLLTVDQIKTLAGRVSGIALQAALWDKGCISSPFTVCYLDISCRRGNGGTPACARPYGYGVKADETPLAPRERDISEHAEELARAGIAAFGVCMPPPGENEFAPEAQIVPVRFIFQAAPRQPSRLAVDDFRGHTVSVAGPIPARVSGSAPSEAEYTTRLYQCAGTPFRCEDARSRVTPGCCIGSDDFAGMKREVLDKLSKARSRPPERKTGKFQPGVRFLPRREEPKVNISLRSVTQLSHELLKLRPETLYLPLEELCGSEDAVKAALAHVPHVVAVLPRPGGDDKRAETARLLEKARAGGISEALAVAPAQLGLVFRAGLSVRTDFAADNSQTLKELRHMGAVSASLSMGLSLKEVREISHVIDTEMTVYGRMPLLHSAYCLIKRGGLCSCESRTELTDASGAPHPVVRDCAHTSLVLDAAKLWLLPEKAQWRHIGLWAVLLRFTTENARECIQVTERHMGVGKYEPNQITKGYYFKEE